MPAPVDPIDFVRTIALARILMPRSHVRLSAGRTEMSDEMQALCFFAGANSIFVGDTLLTADNPGEDKDTACSAGSASKPMELEPRNERRHRSPAMRRRLRGLARKDRLRTLAPRAGLDFTSNDYLGLAASPALGGSDCGGDRAGLPVGAGGSRLLRGNHPEHEALEAEAAAFFGAERALFFGSGYAANFALLPRCRRAAT